MFVSLNASIGFDWRLAPYDVEQSRAHATMLAAAGIISDSDRDELLGGLDRVAASSTPASSRSGTPTRTSTWPSSGG